MRRNRKVALLLAVAVGITSWYVLIGPGSRIVVPSTVGATQEEVNFAFQNLGLRSLISERKFSEDIAEGRVISSIPNAGGRVEQGATIKLILSKGPERFTIPALSGLTPGAARRLMARLPLSLQPNVQEFSESVPK